MMSITELDSNSFLLMVIDSSFVAPRGGACVGINSHDARKPVFGEGGCSDQV